MELGTETIMPITAHVIKHNKELIVSIDIMKVNEQPFMTTISRVIKFGSASEMTNTNMNNVLTVLTTVMGKYT